MQDLNNLEAFMDAFVSGKRDMADYDERLKVVMEMGWIGYRFNRYVITIEGSKHTECPFDE